MPVQKNQTYFIQETAFGWVGVGFSDQGLWSLVLPRDQRLKVLEELASYGLLGQEEIWPELSDDLGAYFEGRWVDFSRFPIDWQWITPFRRKVLETTCTIPWGEVRSYQDVSVLASGYPKASRAVGGAMANNRLPIIIPCHRVIKSDGGLGGFGSGLELKARLLALEGLSFPVQK